MKLLRAIFNEPNWDRLNGFLLALACLSLVGCGGEAYVQGPHLSHVCIVPQWESRQRVQLMCANNSAGACAEVGQFDGQTVRIWAEKPESFNDTLKVCALGHEVLHSLGATHK